MSSLTIQDVTISALPKGNVLGRIAALASSEYSSFSASEEKTNSFLNLPPCEPVATSPLPSEDFSCDLDLEIDPESNELDEVNASALLFFIGKPRERREVSVKNHPSPSPVSQAGNKGKVKKNQSKKRIRGHFPKETTDLLKQWLFDHSEHPYPTEEEKLMVWEQKTYLHSAFR